MDAISKIALVMVATGVGLLIYVLPQAVLGSSLSVSGGLLVFIGPIPVFIGSGDPLMLTILALIMALLTITGLLLFRKGTATDAT